jgi:hypothetical protein
MKNQWIALDKATNTVTRKAASIQDTTKEQLSTIKNSPHSADAAVVDALKKRKLVATGYLLISSHISHN